jgi:hypothetical protein
MRKIAIAIILVLGTACAALADPISITPSTGVLNVSRWESNSNANLDADDVEVLTGCSPGCTLTEVYKQNVNDGNDSGSFASSYVTSFFNAPNDPQDATIDYISGLSITGNPIYLLVKDGSSTPAQYVFDITSWNGTDDLVMTGFWPNDGAISHVAIYTGTGEPCTVNCGPTEIVTPEPGSLLLLGTGLSVLALWARKKATH